MYQKTVLGNGIRLVTEKIPYLHSISLGIWIKTGSRDEEKRENGISHFIEHMLFKGTAKRTAFQIAKEIDSVGGVLNAFTGKEYTSFYARVLDKDLDLSLDLLSDIFLNSLFKPEEVETEREVVLQEIRMVEDTPDEYIQDLFNQSFWQGHSLSFPILGNYKTIKAIQREELVQFFSKTYQDPAKIIVAAAGNLEHEKIVGKIGESLGLLKAKKDADLKNSPHFTPGVYLFPRKLEQIHFCLGTKGLSQTHSLRYGSYLLNAILGGSMSSRLFQEIREKRGLAYSIYSYLASYFDTGSLVIYAGTSPNSLKKVVRLILKELRELRLNSIKDSELQAAKELLKGSLLLSSENAENRMSKLARNEIYFGRFFSLEEIIERIEEVTLSDLYEVLRDIFSPAYLSLVVLGPAKRKNLSPQLLEI